MEFKEQVTVSRNHSIRALNSNRTMSAYQTYDATQRPTPWYFSNDTQRGKRARFVLFVKILFKCLEQSGDAFLIQQTKRLISDFSKISRNTSHSLQMFQYGDSNIASSMESQLRGLVGESNWKRAEKYMKYYIARQGSYFMRSAKANSATTGINKIGPHAA